MTTNKSAAIVRFETFAAYIKGDERVSIGRSLQARAAGVAKLRATMALTDVQALAACGVAFGATTFEEFGNACDLMGDAVYLDPDAQSNDARRNQRKRAFAAMSAYMAGDFAMVEAPVKVLLDITSAMLRKKNPLTYADAAAYVQSKGKTPNGGNADSGATGQGAAQDTIEQGVKLGGNWTLPKADPAIPPADIMLELILDLFDSVNNPTLQPDPFHDLARGRLNDFVREYKLA